MCRMVVLVPLGLVGSLLVQREPLALLDLVHPVVRWCPWLLGIGAGAPDGCSGTAGAWGLAPGSPSGPFGTSSFTAGPVGLGSLLGGDFGDIASLAGSGISELLTVGNSSRWPLGPRNMYGM